jgi:hypothetical protein
MTSEVVENTGESSFGKAQPIGTAGEPRTIDAKQWPSRGSHNARSRSLSFPSHSSIICVPSENGVGAGFTSADLLNEILGFIGRVAASARVAVGAQGGTGRSTHLYIREGAHFSSNSFRPFRSR